MRCPNCTADVRDDAAFCPACGARFEQAQLDPQQTPPYPQQAQLDPQQTPPYPQQAPKKSKKGLIVGIIALVVVLLCGCGCGAIFLVRSLDSEVLDLPALLGDELDSEPGTGAAPEASGYDTAEQAVQAQLAEEGASDWVYLLHDETDASATYWAGPPSSEYVEEIVVARNGDGSWSVTAVTPMQLGGDVPSSSLGAVDQATGVVADHLFAIMEDRAGDAQALTVDPFRSDPASAQYADGQFAGFEITDATEQSDGSVWVRTDQTWYGNLETYEYLVRPTQEGYRIADLRIP